MSSSNSPVADSEGSRDAKKSPDKLWWLKYLRWALFANVLTFVIWQGMKLAKEVDWSEQKLDYFWLFLAAATYLVGWLPCVWFWRMLMAHQGTVVSWPVAIRAHYCGQWGKYVPGKAAVLIIRGSMVHGAGVHLLVGILTAGYESLATIAVGGAVAAALFPWVVPKEHYAKWGLQLLSPDQWGFAMPWLVCIVGALSFSGMSRLIQLVLKKTVNKAVRASQGVESAEGAIVANVHPPWWSIFVLILPWWLHGLSLGCTIHALGITDLHWTHLPRWTAAASLGTVAGFVVLFSPGGLGVREGMLMLTLEPVLGARAAVVPVLLRIVWFVSEVVAAVGCYWLLPSAKRSDKK
ncbi:MAG: lysylphosphatidylglycerol synthase domain-containing protein [Planctomycetales bacterium]